MDTSSRDLNTLLVEQLDWHWSAQLRPRLEGLSDEEYFWEPVPGSWNLRRRGTADPALAVGTAGDLTIDFTHPAPQPAPVTTIAWRLGHLIVGCLLSRVHGHFGGPEVDYDTHIYASTAAEALAQLDGAYAAWVDGVRSWGVAGLDEPCGPSEGPFAAEPRTAIVLHINRELIHHGAEIALLRDLWAHRTL